VERPVATIDEHSDAVRVCDRPGLEGGVSFWDCWREHRDPNWGMYGGDGL
jgi:hypothetical protein